MRRGGGTGLSDRYGLPAQGMRAISGHRARVCAHALIKVSHASCVRWRAGTRLPRKKVPAGLKGFAGWTDQMCWLAITSDGNTHILHLQGRGRDSSGSVKAADRAVQTLLVGEPQTGECVLGGLRLPSCQYQLQGWPDFSQVQEFGFYGLGTHSRALGCTSRFLGLWDARASISTTTLGGLMRCYACRTQHAASTRWGRQKLTA